MNVCHVITRLIIGGAQENTLLTCEGLTRRGHKVTLVVGPDTGPEGSLIQEARAGGYDVRIIPSMHRAIRPWADLAACRQLWRLFRDLNPDIVHTHSSKAGILGRWAACRARVPIIVHTIHGMSFNRTQSAPIRYLYRLLERRCARYTDALIGVAEAMARQSIEAGIASPDRFVTIYSGMKTGWYDPARYDRRAVRQQWGFGEDCVVFGTVARLFRNKGYEQLIPAMAEASRRCPNLRFVWVGDGAQRSEYESQLLRLGLTDRVRLTGLVPPLEVARLLAGMDVVVHASQWEGLPRVVAQGLIMSKAVISFDIDGAPEVVLPEQTGLLVRLNDIQGLAEAMVRLAGDVPMRERMGRAGRELCLRRFDHDRMVDEIESLYKKLTDRRK
ncbi:MAG: glycosyltransferase family 4 protein [Phycisphaerae bacterium]